jgi:dGTPase
MTWNLNIRQRMEEMEENLSPYAIRSRLSRGRLKYEEPCPVRTAFQRDRDRIIHSKAFRRLKHKTQVFIAPIGDHYITRLTHTLEVAQLARTIACALNLNEDLTEAISLGHDLGHTPFGHIGEEVLNELYRDGFRHNEQSLRVVDLLEKDGRGLNLNWEVRDGILNHSKARSGILMGSNSGQAATLEGQVCQIADAVAYINHDIGDAIRAGVIGEGDLPAEATTVLGHCHSGRINTMVMDIIESSWVASGEITGEPMIKMSAPVLGASDKMRHFLFKRVYNDKGKKAAKASEAVQRLYKYFCRHEDKMPLEYLRYSDEAERRAVDFIAGMTDHYATRLDDRLRRRAKIRIKAR